MSKSFESPADEPLKSIPPVKSGLPIIPSALSTVQGSELLDSPEEPVIDVDDIQGNVLAGFNKNHQTFLFLEILDPESAKLWIRAIIPHIATVEETLAFNRLFRALRNRRNEEARGLVATWINIAFTWSGIQKLTSADELNKFLSGAFKLGMPKRAGTLGDPTDNKSNPTGWVVGGPNNPVDILLIVASDSKTAMRTEVGRIKRSVVKGKKSIRGPLTQGLRLLYAQEGETLPQSLTGHEHFGFKDGISQPGIRGRISAGPLDYLTPRLIDPADPLALTHSRPGQPLIWPGQFVLGKKYPLQNRFDALQPLANEEPAPSWATNGSFLVLRRLRQDVAAFWQFMEKTSNSIALKYPTLSNLTPERLASIFIGRWPSGVPIMREPLADNPALAGQDFALNDFNFTNATGPTRLVTNSGEPPDTFPLAPADASGLRCPFAAHIRKVNPRDDTTELGGPERTLPRRILRRGLPYGKPLVNPLQPENDHVDRGLMFVAYQASIEDQFEFLMTDWANSTLNPRSYISDSGNPQTEGGRDPVIGQTGAPSRERSFTLRIDAHTFESVPVPQDFVIPTGGGYFFTPSITALRTILIAPKP